MVSYWAAVCINGELLSGRLYNGKLLNAAVCINGELLYMCDNGKTEHVWNYINDSYGIIKVIDLMN